MSKASKWGVPDWREADAYPAATQLTLREWWWEFTRRRPDYRIFWNQADELEGQSYRYAPDVNAFRLKFELSVIHDPARRCTDWDLMHHRVPRNGGIGKSSDHLNIKAFKACAQNPDTAVLVDQAAAERKKQAKLEEAAGSYGFQFNLRAPLKPQLRKAEEHLQAIQDELFGRQNTQRPREDRFPMFLRALDARDVGATYAEMREVFWPDDNQSAEDLIDESRARELLRSAVRVRDNFQL